MRRPPHASKSVSKPVTVKKYPQKLAAKALTFGGILAALHLERKRFAERIAPAKRFFARKGMPRHQGKQVFRR